MNSRKRRHELWRGGLVVTLAMALLSQTIGIPANAAGAAPPGQAGGSSPDTPTVLSPRAKLLIMWRSGGSLVKAEAAKALVGSDAEVEEFLSRKLDRLPGIDDRIVVNQIMSAGGPTVKASARKALDAADTDDKALRTFLDAGFRDASYKDLRIRVNQIMSAGGPTVKASARKALDADSDGALQEFLRTTSVLAGNTDLRIRVNQIMSAGGPTVKASARKALDADSPDALRLFISREWEVAEARDQETASIAQLVAAARVAGEQAAQETQASIDAAGKALIEAELARQATELAAKAAEAAKDNAQGAAEAASRAADAANRAADAAVQAIGAANAASAAARVAAHAATRAAAAAAKAGQASSNAWHYAAAARTDRKHVGAAKQAAADAGAASKSAQDAVSSLNLAQEALEHAQVAIDAATSAGENAVRSAKAAGESVKWAQAAGADARQVQAAAEKARREADRATRAAAAARAFATEAAGAAAQAREFANRAAADAALAAAAADDAAEHAGQGQNAAQQATDHANAASSAAQTANDAAAQAQRVRAAASKADNARIELEADQATDAAREAQNVQDTLGLTRDWNSAQETRRDQETNQLLAAATAAGADPALVATNGRKVAFRLMTVSGPWTKAAAENALTGSDPEVREFVQAGIGQAAGLDDRESLRELVADASPSMKKAADIALAGSDDDVKRFLQTRDYPKRYTDYRVAVNQVMSAAREAGDNVVVATARKVLDSDDTETFREFLNTGQNRAREKDDRITINQLISNPATGPETRLLGRAALEGPPSIIKQFRHIGRYIAARHDQESAAHTAAVAGLVAEATAIASKASENAANAQFVAATARNAVDQANDWASKASGFANNAQTYANQANESANQADESARQANQSAIAANEASQRASQAAVRANQSAVQAQHSASIASNYARSAIQASRQAYQDAIDAGKDAKEAVRIANEAKTQAIDRANKEIADAKQKFADDVKKQCDKVPAGADRDDCIQRATRLIADPKGESERNVAVCNQLKQYSEDAFSNCLKGALNPSLNYQINKAIADAKQKAKDEQDSKRWWSIAGTIVAGAILVGVGLYCAEVCTAPLLSALIGAEAGVLAEAAGAGIGLTIGTEFATGVIADSFLASRVTALAQVELLGNIALRNGLGNLEIQFAKQAGSCSSFTPNTNVLMGDGTRKEIKDVAVGDVVLATDPDTGRNQEAPVTDLITSSGEKHLVDVRIRRADSGSGTVTATAQHPFWVASAHRWVNAEDLAPGDQLATPDGTVAIIDGVARRTERQRVHNLTIENVNTYYVFADNTPVLVHNSTCLLLASSLTVAEAANPIVESLRTFGKLPSNFVTKLQAEAAGWEAGKALANYLPGAQLGGDIFKNADNLLPSAPGRTWYEADVGINSAMKRSKQPGWRLTYSDDGLTYITFDHYKLFYQLPNWK